MKKMQKNSLRGLLSVFKNKTALIGGLIIVIRFQYNMS